jgi:hypothetical protein
MKRNVLVSAAFVALSLTAAPAPAQEVQYWGLWQSTERGLIRLQDEYYTVGKGDEIPGFGTVQQATDDMLTVRRTLTEAERQRLAEQGRVAPDTETRRIPNLTNRVGPPLMRGTPGPWR